MLTWALGPLTFDQRGRGTGVRISAILIGQFFRPLLELALTGALGGWARRWSCWVSSAWRWQPSSG